MIHVMNRRLLFAGLAIWLVGTVALRVVGQRLLRPNHSAATLILFAVSFPLMAVMVRRLCIRAGLPPERWLSGAISVALPTLLLDPFSSAFFPLVFPNMSPEVAGVFGGWMLWCCAGALIGAMVPARQRA